jgi:hypothetical protein
MANEVQIVNIALTWLGQDVINSLGDNQTEAKIMNANYATSRDKVLADHAWTFAIRREVLAPVAAPTEFGTPNKFLIPSDVLRVQRVYRPSNDQLQATDLQNARWVKEGNFIVAREESVWAHFIFRNTNTDEYPAPFVHALAARLAADTAIAFTENRKLFEQMEMMYIDKLADATFSDGSQGRTEVIRSTKLTGARTR